jgi:predicted porin
MKRSLLAAAVLGSAATLAAAQSSVTLFGIVDASARSVKNGSAGSQKQLASGGNSTSRWGLRGVEDLGGGLRAGFHLESQINLDAGTVDTAKFFGRRSTVSLLGGFGEVRMGRDYTPTAYNTFADEFGIVGVGSRGIFSYGSGANLGSAATTVLRTDNSIGYFLPSLGGVYGHVQVAAGEGAIGNKYVGARIGYAGGPVNVGFAYGQTELASNTPDFKNYNLMFNWNFGFATLYTLYDVKDWAPRKTKDLSVAVGVPFGASTFKLGYTRADRSGGPVGSGYANADDSTRLGIGYQYDLSKRTAIYTNYGRVTNKGAARSSVLYAPPTGMLGGQLSTGYEFGVRHLF